MTKIITAPFSWLMMKFYDLFGNIGIAVILFALVVNLILTPFMLKSKKSMMRQTRLQPRLKQLEAQHGGNPQKYQQEVSKLYQEEHINPMSGCLWSLIPFPILIALYSVIRKPLSIMMGLATETVELIQTTLEGMGLLNLAELSARQQQYIEIVMTQLCHENYDVISAVVPEVQDVSYAFLGMNLGNAPQRTFWNAEGFGAGNWWPALGLFLIPFISAFLSWLSMKVSMASNPGANDNTQAAATNKSMMLMMPLMSVWICFVMPAVMGVYWIANSVFGMLRDWILTKVVTKQMYEEDKEWLERERLREEEIERKRLETERRKAEGTSTVNRNTSKKKLQAAEKQKVEEIRAAAAAAERAERRERLGVEEAEVPASQVGSRRYARGRAYDPDRFGAQQEVSPAPEADGVEE